MSFPTYEERVNNFIQQHGPNFILKCVDYISTDEQDCEARGRRAIHNLFHIQNEAGKEFIVGSECQNLVLTRPEDLAKLPARHIRQRDIEELVTLGAMLQAKIDKVLVTSEAITFPRD